jgi:hypothetical protein
MFTNEFFSIFPSSLTLISVANCYSLLGFNRPTDVLLYCIARIYFSLYFVKYSLFEMKTVDTNNMCSIRGCIHKFPDWPPGVRTANVTALCH